LKFAKKLKAKDLDLVLKYLNVGKILEESQLVQVNLINYFKVESNLKESQRLLENSDVEKPSLLIHFVLLLNFQEVKVEVKVKFFILILKIRSDLKG
jgi:hypothetical protein